MVASMLLTLIAQGERFVGTDTVSPMPGKNVAGGCRRRRSSALSVRVASLREAGSGWSDHHVRGGRPVGCEDSGHRYENPQMFAVRRSKPSQAYPDGGCSSANLPHHQGNVRPTHYPDGSRSDYQTRRSSRDEGRVHMVTVTPLRNALQEALSWVA